jgi:hypothetical protein
LTSDPHALDTIVAGIRRYLGYMRKDKHRTTETRIGATG